LSCARLGRANLSRSFAGAANEVSLLKCDRSRAWRLTPRRTRGLGGWARLSRGTDVFLAVTSRRSPGSARCRRRVAQVASGDDVTDLFSGVGLFSVPLAKRVGPAGRVTAVESSPYAVRDARENATGLGNIKVREWSVTHDR